MVGHDEQERAHLFEHDPFLLPRILHTHRVDERIEKERVSMEVKLEVVIIRVSNVDRTRALYP
jgi:hypothetical protein